jgi:hypothetical protein
VLRVSLGLVDVRVSTEHWPGHPKLKKKKKKKKLSPQLHCYQLLFLFLIVSQNITFYTMVIFMIALVGHLGFQYMRFIAYRVARFCTALN